MAPKTLLKYDPSLSSQQQEEKEQERVAYSVLMDYTYDSQHRIIGKPSLSLSLNFILLYFSIFNATANLYFIHHFLSHFLAFSAMLPRKLKNNLNN